MLDGIKTEWNGTKSIRKQINFANPCSDKIKDIINLKIKRREKLDLCSIYLKRRNIKLVEKDLDVPYMGVVLKIKEDKENYICILKTVLEGYKL